MLDKQRDKFVQEGAAADVLLQAVCGKFRQKEKAVVKTQRTSARDAY